MSKSVYLKFSDGTRYDDADAGYADEQLWLYFRNTPIKEVLNIAFDETRNNKVTFVCGDMKYIYSNFVPVAVIHSIDEIKVRMIGGTVEEAKADEGDLAGDGSAELPDGDGSES